MPTLGAAATFASNKWLQKQCTDNIGKYDPVFYLLKKRGQIGPKIYGGNKLLEPLAYEFNDQVAGLPTMTAALAIKKQEGFTNAEYTWAHYGGITTFFHDEILACSGEPEMINLIKERTEQTARSFLHVLANHLYGTQASAHDKITGLGYALDATAEGSQTKTVGGIDKTTYTWWRHKTMTGTEGLGATSGTIADGVAYGINLATFQGRPDLVIMTLSFYQTMVNQIRTLERFVKEGTEMADAGFTNVLVNGVETTWSRYMTENTTDYPAYTGTDYGHAFIVNTENMALRTQGGTPFEPQSQLIKGIPGTPGVSHVIQHYLECQLTFSSMRAHCRMFRWHHAS